MSIKKSLSGVNITLSCIKMILKDSFVAIYSPIDIDSINQ